MTAAIILLSIIGLYFTYGVVEEKQSIKDQEQERRTYYEKYGKRKPRN